MGSFIEWTKKAEKLPALSATVMAPDVNDPGATVLELDELWSFVLKKTNQPGYGLPCVGKRVKWSPMP